MSHTFKPKQIYAMPDGRGIRVERLGLNLEGEVSTVHCTFVKDPLGKMSAPRAAFDDANLRLIEDVP